jgi:hypothetical protein
MEFFLQVSAPFPFWLNAQFSPRSLGLSATNQQYFSLRTNQPPATSQQYSSLKTNQHQPSATSQPNRLFLGPLAAFWRHDFQPALSQMLIPKNTKHL